MHIVYGDKRDDPSHNRMKSKIHALNRIYENLSPKLPMYFAILCLHIVVISGLLKYTKGKTNNSILEATNEVWEAGQANFFSESDLVYNSSSGGRLFTYVNEDRFTGTYAKLIALFDNYNSFSGHDEKCNETCESEVNAFLDAIVSSPAMMKAMDFLGQYETVLGSEAGMKDYLKAIWFTPYSRTHGALDSSGFEHVFLGEVHQGQTIGYHGWEKIYFDEKAGNFKYTTSLDRCEPNIPKFSMSLHGYPKAVTANFVRTPPEVELALYTICFRLQPGSMCDVNLGGNIQPIQTYVDNCINNFDNSCVGSAFPRC